MQMRDTIGSDKPNNNWSIGEATKITKECKA